MTQPTLSLGERDRRWGLARDLMKEKGLDCLIVTPGNAYYSPDHFDAWLTNDNAYGTVIFPLKGDPCYIVWSPMHGTMRMLENSRRGITPWIEDYRVYHNPNREGIVPLLKEKGLDSANIGVVSLQHGGPGSGGGIAYRDWSDVLEQLPEAGFVEIKESYAALGLVKSEEEIELARYASDVGEKACEAMLKAVRPGVSESEIYATIMHAIFKNGADSLHVILHSGADNFSWGKPMWTSQAQDPRVVGQGDLVQAEVFPIYGGIESQQQMAVATKPVDSVTRELADTARKSYEAAINIMRPGVTFGQVCDAMRKPLDDAGCWHLTPLAHTMNPIIYVSAVVSGVEQAPEFKDFGFQEVPMRPEARDFVLEPGIMFELEPNAVREKRKVNIGGTVIITPDGVEELNTLAVELHVVD